MRAGSTIDGAVIEAAAGGHHRGDLQCAVDDIGALFASTHGHDHALRRVDDRVELLDAEHAEVGQAGGAALIFMRLQFAFTGLLGQFLHIGADRGKTARIGFRDDRRDEAAGGSHRDRDIGTAVTVQRIALIADVAIGHAHQRAGQRLDQQIVDRQLDPVRFQTGIELFAQVEQRIETDVDGKVIMRDLLLALGEAARNDLAHVGELFFLVRRAVIAGGCLSGRFRFVLVLGSGGIGSGFGRAAFCAFDICLHDPATRTGAGYGGKIDAVLLGDAASQGRCDDAFTAIVLGRGGCLGIGIHRCACGLGAFARCGLGRFRFVFGFVLGGFFFGRLFIAGWSGGCRLVHIFAFFGENGDHRADLYTFGPCFDCDRGNGAFVHSFEFHRRLVGFDFGHDVTGADRITRLHKPFGERALLHGGRKGGHLDRRWHGCLRYVLAGEIVRPHLWRKGAVLARSLRRIRISE